MTRVKEAETNASCNVPKFRDFNGISASPCIELSQRNTAAVFRCAIILASRLSQQGLFTCLHINYFRYLIRGIKGFVTLWKRRFSENGFRRDLMRGHVVAICIRISVTSSIFHRAVTERDIHITYIIFMCKIFQEENIQIQ